MHIHTYADTIHNNNDTFFSIAPFKTQLYRAYINPYINYIHINTAHIHKYIHVHTQMHTCTGTLIYIYLLVLCNSSCSLLCHVHTSAWPICSHNITLQTSSVLDATGKICHKNYSLPKAQLIILSRTRSQLK